MRVFRSPKEALQEYGRLKSDRGNFESTWQQIADNVIGSRDFRGATTPGRRRMSGIYDTTGLQSAILLAGGLHGMLTSPSQQWFRLVPEDAALLEVEGMVAWLQETERVLLRAFQHPEGNFSGQVAELYLDLVSFGTGAMWVGETPTGVLFSTRPLSEIVIQENSEGRVDTVWRSTNLTARQVEDRWPGKSPTARRLLDAGSHGNQLEVIEVTYRNTDPRARSNEFLFPWVRRTYLRTEEVEVEASGHREMPWLVPRWLKEASEVYGRGPGWVALPDQKMLNEMSKTLLKAAQKSVDPPLVVTDDGVVGQPNTAPGGQIVVRGGFGSERPVSLLEMPGSPGFGITVELIRQRQGMVRQAFFAQLFQLFEDPRMSATQVLELSRQIQRLMGPMLGRVQTELHEPAVERVYGILRRKGLVPDPPAAASGAPLRIDFVSPVARAQRLAEARSVLEVWQAAQVIGAVEAGVFDGLDPDESLRVIHEANGAPASILRTSPERDRIRQARMQALAQQQQQQQLAQVAQSAGRPPQAP